MFFYTLGFIIKRLSVGWIARYFEPNILWEGIRIDLLPPSNDTDSFA